VPASRTNERLRAVVEPEDVECVADGVGDQPVRDSRESRAALYAPAAARAQRACVVELEEAAADDEVARLERDGRRQPLVVRVCRDAAAA